MQRLGQLLSRMWPAPHPDPYNPANTHIPGLYGQLPCYAPPFPPNQHLTSGNPPVTYHDAGISGLANTTECIKANVHYGDGTGSGAAAFYSHYYMAKSHSSKAIGGESMNPSPEVNPSDFSHQGEMSGPSGTYKAVNKRPRETNDSNASQFEVKKSASMTSQMSWDHWQDRNQCQTTPVATLTQSTHSHGAIPKNIAKSGSAIKL